jgi:hypothetical protein
MLEAANQSAFLKPLKGEAAKLCKLGHQMEPIYGMNILEAAKNGVQFENGSLLVIQHLFRAGLVQKSGSQKDQNDSLDFVLIGTLDGEHFVAIVELKCRSNTNTQNAE